MTALEKIQPTLKSNNIAQSIVLTAENHPGNENIIGFFDPETHKDLPVVLIEGKRYKIVFHDPYDVTDKNGIAIKIIGIEGVFGVRIDNSKYLNNPQQLFLTDSSMLYQEIFDSSIKQITYPPKAEFVFFLHTLDIIEEITEKNTLMQTNTLAVPPMPGTK